MSKRRTLYDRTLDNLKNNKLVVFGLIALAVLGSILTLAEKLTDMAAGMRGDAAAPLIEYSQVVLAADQPWEPIPRDAPNYFIERERSLAGDDPKELRDIEARAREAACPYMFAHDDWCAKANGFFSQRGLQNIAIDPRFDVLIFNPGDQPVILQGLAVEIVHASHVVVSLGDWETTRIPVDATYEIPMPAFPSAWLANELAAEAMKEQAGRDVPLTAGDVCHLMSIGGDQCEWNLPILAKTAIRDPILLKALSPYRFELVLRDYFRLPNNVVIRFVVETNRGSIASGYYYLLAM